LTLRPIREFVSNYVEEFGTDTTVTNSAEAAYHGVYLLKEAIEAAGGSLDFRGYRRMRRQVWNGILRPVP
jgi:ABC-type branched-subunit amino acid transport system substrate-binding protein